MRRRSMQRQSRCTSWPFRQEIRQNACIFRKNLLDWLCTRLYKRDDMMQVKEHSPMLTPEELCAWCQRLRLSKETEEIITSIRSSPQVRKVRGRAGNVSGKYPSPKMQVSIQFESQHVGIP